MPFWWTNRDVAGRGFGGLPLRHLTVVSRTRRTGGICGSTNRFSSTTRNASNRRRAARSAGLTRPSRSHSAQHLAPPLAGTVPSTPKAGRCRSFSDRCAWGPDDLQVPGRLRQSVHPLDRPHDGRQQEHHHEAVAETGAACTKYLGRHAAEPIVQAAPVRRNLVVRRRQGQESVEREARAGAWFGVDLDGHR